MKGGVLGEVRGCQVSGGGVRREEVVLCEGV